MLSYYAIAASIALSVSAYLDRRLLQPARLPRVWSTRLRAGVYLHALLLPAALVLCLRAPRGLLPVAIPLGRVAFLDEGVLLLLVTLCLARDLIALVLGSLRLAGVPRTPTDRSVVGAMGRRDVFRGMLGWLGAPRVQSGALVATSVALGTVGHANAISRPRVVRVRVTVTNLAPALRGLRIAQISDLHVGPTIRAGTVAAIVAQVTALQPDIIAITGDLVDGFVSQLLPELSAITRLRCPLGTYFVPGNHEYFYRAQEWLAALGSLGVTVLLNEHRTLTVDRHGARASLLLAGTGDEAAPADLPGHAPDLARALQRAPSVDYKVLLAHRPSGAPHAAAAGMDLQLSGHLHGGQFVPWTALVRALEPWVAGLYTVGAMRLYVSRGAGYWGPSLRLDAPSEIALIELADG